jgi:hypothetical protein
MESCLINEKLMESCLINEKLMGNRYFMSPDRALEIYVRPRVERDGSILAQTHEWGHLKTTMV